MVRELAGLIIDVQADWLKFGRLKTLQYDAHQNLFVWREWRHTASEGVYGCKEVDLAGDCLTEAGCPEVCRPGVV
jgi:hypothetical protein